MNENNDSNEVAQGSRSRVPGAVRPKFRLRLRFRLRTLLLVVIPISAFGVWAGMKYRKSQLQRSGIQWVSEQNGHFVYDYQAPLEDGSFPVGAEPPGPDWMREWLGDDFFCDIHGVILDNRELTDLSPLEQLEELQSLAIFIDILPEADLAPLSRLKKLKTLSLNYTEIDKSMLKELELALPECEVFIGPDVTFR